MNCFHNLGLPCASGWYGGATSLANGITWLICIIGSVADAGPDNAVGVAPDVELVGSMINGGSCAADVCGGPVPTVVAADGIVVADAAACSALGSAPT